METRNARPESALRLLPDSGRGGVPPRSKPPSGKPVTKPSLNYLKIYQQQTLDARRPDIESMASLSAVAAAFRAATGWSLRFPRGPKPTHPTEHASSAPVNPGVGTPPGHALLDPVRSASAATEPRIDRQAAERLAEAIGALVSEDLKAQHALWQREAELAAAVPVVVRPGQGKHFAARLESVLRNAAKTIGCDAAGLYLLDEGTTSLKLRSSWGLPRQRLAEPPRSLSETLADLEAMLGHAVCLEDVGLLSHWRAPEDFPSAACVPVSSANTILGTLWVFSKRRRAFGDRDTHALEAAAGRLAAELEREALLREGVEAARLKREIVAAEQFERSLMPSVAPALPGWDIGGWVSRPGSLGGGFFDWFPLDRAKIGVALGHAGEEGIRGALAASALRASLRAHAAHCRRPRDLLHRANLDLWTASVGDQGAALFYTAIDPSKDRVPLSLAGALGRVIVGPEGCQRLPCNTPSLGACRDTHFRQETRRLLQGESLLVFTERDADRRNASGIESELARVCSENPRLGSRDLASFAGAILEARCPAPVPTVAILAIKRTDP